MKFPINFPIEMFYGVLAVAGGIVRYLQGYARGDEFKFRIFCANIFISGFSGYMFALLGENMNLPAKIVLMMAGTGGFMGTTAMDIVVGYLTDRVGKRE